MEPKYKFNPLTGELQEYVFEYNGILALRNFTAKVEDERLILHAADDVNFSILEALVSEVEINGVVYDNPTAAQEALTRLTFNQNRPVLLDKSLKDLILGAVQKIPGKKLSTEDFTTELRQKLEGLQQVDTSGLLPKGSYTGTAQDLKNLIDNINRILQSDDTDLDQLQEIVTYIKQNKHILSTLGINNIAGLVEALAAKADKDHHHDERYAPITHHHNEYAHRTHRHNKDDIDGLPANIATIENVKTAVDGIQIGGRNLLLNSGVVVTNSNYQVASYQVTEDINIGDTITLSIDADVPKNCQIVLLNSAGGGAGGFGNLREGVNVWDNEKKVSIKKGGGFLVYVIGNNEGNKETTIRKIKLERGNKATDWSPAPEDLVSEKLWTKQQHSLYGEIHHSDKPIVTREVFLESTNSKTNIWTENNELHVGSKKIGSYTKVVASGFKIPGKTDGDIPLAGGGTLTTQQLLGRVVGVEVLSNWTADASWQNNTIFIKTPINIELNQLQNLSSMSFRKVFDVGTITFTCEEKTIKYTTDNIFNGKDGSTAVVSIYKNTCYIDIRNI